MRKSFRILVIVLISLLVLMGIFSTVYLTSPKFYYLCQEDSQRKNLSFDLFCLKHNYRLIQLKIPNEILLNEDQLEKKINEISKKGSAVLMSPLVSYCVSNIGFQTKAEEAVFIGISAKNENSSFDFYLNYNAADGWNYVRRYIEGKGYNPLFIYNESTLVQKGAFENELEGEIPTLKLESYGNRFVSQVKLQVSENVII